MSQSRSNFFCCTSSVVTRITIGFAVTASTLLFFASTLSKTSHEMLYLPDRYRPESRNLKYYLHPVYTCTPFHHPLSCGCRSVIGFSVFVKLTSSFSTSKGSTSLVARFIRVGNVGAASLKRREKTESIFGFKLFVFFPLISLPLPNALKPVWKKRNFLLYQSRKRIFEVPLLLEHCGAFTPSATDARPVSVQKQQRGRLSPLSQRTYYFLRCLVPHLLINGHILSERGG